MKISLTIISLLAFQYLTLAQNSSKVNAKSTASETSSKSKTFFVHCPENDHTRARYSPSHQNKTIVIANIPSTGLILNSVNLDLDEMGTFTFKKADDLIIPNNQVVFIEDKVSGLLFNISNAQTYKFNVEQNISNRFVMHVLNKAEPEIELTVK